MTSRLKVAAAGVIVAASLGGIPPAMAQTYLGAPVVVDVAPFQVAERLCLRFDNKSLIDRDDEGQDAYDRAAALGNRCFSNIRRLNYGVTILPFPRSDTLNDRDFYFLTREQRRALGIGDPP
ncbi:hypothetical protein PRN20_16125 [Devosia sp. ZB163]|uniref:hypothetical protein n=1 Tax=Devosia sp. ZB163 TaxID=3025938 RepID=UPI002362CAD1|nr:hypothetical protein [Devosia sp. ZB163]MDC9825258.1 hypothetical protein [Devosia sp. ZB163]